MLNDPLDISVIVSVFVIKKIFFQFTLRQLFDQAGKIFSICPGFIQ